MEHPPKQGLKLLHIYQKEVQNEIVLMEHPPKQGLKQSFLNPYYNLFHKF